jgi:hypothetical protein
MDAGAHARIARELPRRGWTPENHEKILDFLASYAGSGTLALFDADNTAWTGDVGDSALVHLLRNLRMSPRLADILPEQMDVPAEGYGTGRAGRIFPAARVREALLAMTSAYRAALAPQASVDELLRGFSPAWEAPLGPLHVPSFLNAHRAYAGTIVAVYNLLEASVGCLAFDPADPTGARDATSWFPEPVRPFFGTAVVFPEIRDTGPGQRALQVAGKLGSYSQIALWKALDKTPEEVRALGLEVFTGSPVDTPYQVAFPVDESSATSPAPLDFTVDPALFVPGAHPAPGIVQGGSRMLEGTQRRPEIADLFAAMAREGIVPVIITASHVELVRAVADRHYGFAGHPVIGMSPVLTGGRYGAELTAPATYRHGKVDAARKVARLVTGDEDARPAFAAGDTTTDLEMLAYATSCRLFFDRKKRELMELADFLAQHGMGAQTLVQPPL